MRHQEKPSERNESTPLLAAALEGYDDDEHLEDENSTMASSPRERKAVRTWIGCSFVLLTMSLMGSVVWIWTNRSSSSMTPTLQGKNDDQSPNVSLRPYLASHVLAKTKVKSECTDGKYSKRSLKLAYELPFAALFPNTKGMTKFEASSVIVNKEDGYVYSICDSSWSIFKFHAQLQPFVPTNVLIGDPQRVPDEESGYEALFQDANGTLYAVRESVQHDSGEYHAIIEEIDLSPNDDDDYDVSHICSTEFEFEGNSKGFEGAVSIQDLNNEIVVLGLCEGNHCSESPKKKLDRGNGRVVLMRKTHIPHKDGKRQCQWSTIRQIDVPSTAHFLDYSAMSIDMSSGRVAISSQEDSSLWVGQLLGGHPMPTNDKGGMLLWDVDTMEFDPTIGEVYMFPKNDDCETVYCNIEGVSWIDNHTIVAVSDKMKGHGRQDFRCEAKDQSVHVFQLP